MPLALALISAVAAAEGDEGQRFGNSPPFDAARYRWIERQLRDTDVNDDDDDDCDDCDEQHHAATPSVGTGGGCNDGAGTLRKVIKLGFDTLRRDGTRECFMRLGVLPQGAVVEEGMLGSLWEQVRLSGDRFRCFKLWPQYCSYIKLGTRLGSFGL